MRTVCVVSVGMRSWCVVRRIALQVAYKHAGTYEVHVCTYIAGANTITLEFNHACGYIASYIPAILTSIKCTYVASRDGTMQNMKISMHCPKNITIQRYIAFLK